MEESDYDHLLVELECPVCMNYMVPPIVQCTGGHSICETCRKRLTKCALCQDKFTDIRNITLEKLATKMHYPCIFRQMGCTQKFQYNERDNHADNCTYKGYACPYEKCSYIGKFQDLMMHWDNKNLSFKPYKKSNICHLKMVRDNQQYFVNVLNAFSKTFWFKFKLTRDTIYWAVQFVNNDKEADKFYYEIEIFTPELPKQRIVVGNYCHPISLSNDLLFRKNVCSSLPRDSIGKFITNDKLLIYYMRVNSVKDLNDDSTIINDEYNTKIKITTTTTTNNNNNNNNNAAAADNASALHRNNSNNKPKRTPKKPKDNKPQSKNNKNQPPPPTPSSSSCNKKQNNNKPKVI